MAIAIGARRLPLRDVEPMPDNERKTYTPDGLEKLLRSIIKTGGNMTPVPIEVIVPEEYHESRLYQELLKETSLMGLGTINERKQELMINFLLKAEGVRLRQIAGSRRRISLGLAGLEYILGKLFLDVSEEERIRMMIAENTTKTKIPSHEMAESFWGLYNTFLGIRLKVKTWKELSSRYKDYWSMPSYFRSVLSMNEFASILRRSQSSIAGAFRWQKLSEPLKEEVRKGNQSYSAMIEFAKLDPEDQVKIFNVTQREKDKKLTVKEAAKYVAASMETDFSLVIEKPLQYRTKRGITPRLKDASKIFTNVYHILTIYPETFKMNGWTFSDCTLEGIVREARTVLEELDRHYTSNKTYCKSKADFDSDKSSLIEKIISGKIKIDTSDTNKIPEIDLSKAEYRFSIPIKDIFPCPDQPRQTFNDDAIKNLALSIGKDGFGIMQPIMVRPKDGGYEIIAGETRYWAANEACLTHIDAVVIDVPDEVAQILRQEEDLYEEVSLGERAEKLLELYIIMAKREGEEFTKKRFLEEVRLSSSVVEDALLYATLDKQTKLMQMSGLISYSTALKLAEIEEPKRHPYAIYAAVSGCSGDEVYKMYLKDSYEPCLPFRGFDKVGERQSGVVRSTVDLLKQYVDFLKAPDVKKLTRKQQFLYIHQIGHILEKIEEPIPKPG